MKQRIWEYAAINDFHNACDSQAIVLVGGCFDLIHYGHLRFFKDARTHGDLLVVALEPDEHIKKFKKRAPVHTQQERAELLEALTYVDAVIKLPFFTKDDEYQVMVEQLRPQVIAVSSPDKHIEKKRAHADKIGARVIEVTPILPQFATRRIIEQLS